MTYLFYGWWTFELLWNLIYYKECCYKLFYTYLLMHMYGSVLRACLSRWGTARSFRACVHSSVQSLSCVHSLQPHGLQHARLPCPSPIPGAYSNSCPSSRWCHPTISSSVIPFSSCLQSFPASGSNESVLQSGSQSIGVSALASVLPMNIQDWFPLGWTGPLLSKGLSRAFSSTTAQKHQFFSAQLSL